MTNYNEELKTLTKHGLLPDTQYLTAQRFTKHYQNTDEFYEGIAAIAYLPIINGISACFYAMKAVWATLRAVGNLLILKPGYAGDAVEDLGFNLMLTILLGVMAPVHALTSSLELLTRTISSWFTGQESVADLSQLNFAAKWSEEIVKHKDLLPSSTYFKSSRFFSPYQDALDCLEQLASPVVIACESSLESLYQAVNAVNSAISCISNLVICKPQHALENFRDCSIHTSISLALAVMAVINALVESVAFISRLGTTWISACQQPEAETTKPEAEATTFGIS